MNIVLFEPDETTAPLPVTDPRAQHVLNVLRCRPGDSFDAGLIDGPRGKATLVAVDEASLRLDFTWGEEPPPLDAITLIIGLPRPQTARKILEEATALGVAAMHFVGCDRAEPSYARSRLWSSDEWRGHLVNGAAQAFSTRLPLVTSGGSLAEAIAAGPADATCLALDNYEASRPFPQPPLPPPLVLAFGPERGWSAAERDLLRAEGFELVHLGQRVLRLETACVAAVALAKAATGLL